MILSISDIDHGRTAMATTGFIYLFVSLFCVLFGAIYEYFSHEVFSFYMLYAFVIPLVGGVLPFFLLAFSRARIPGRAALNLYHSGISTITVGSILQGVLEIYGTTNRLICAYWIVGAFFLLWGISLYLSERPH